MPKSISTSLITTLPIDIHYYISMFLCFKGLTRLRLTSRYFYNHLLEERFLKHRKIELLCRRRREEDYSVFVDGVFLDGWSSVGKQEAVLFLSTTVSCVDYTSFQFLHQQGMVKQSRVSQVNICSEESLTDLQPFMGIPSVTLINCGNVADLSPLRLAKRLKIDSCLLVNDLSLLGHVEDLTIIRCPLVSDVSCLRTVGKLLISECPLVTDVSSLKDVSNLEIRDCPITKYGTLDCVENLTLRCMSHSVDYSVFRNVKDRLTISTPSDRFVDVSPFSNIRHVRLDYCQCVTDVSSLSVVESVDLEACTNLVDITPLVSKSSNVKHLTLTCMSSNMKDHLVVVENHLQSLKISYSSQGIEHVTINGTVERMVLVTSRETSIDVGLTGSLFSLSVDKWGSIDLSKLGKHLHTLELAGFCHLCTCEEDMTYPRRLKIRDGFPLSKHNLEKIRKHVKIFIHNHGDRYDTYNNNVTNEENRKQ